MAKEFLNQKKVSFVEYDVSTDESKRNEMVEKSHQLGVPVIQVGGELFVGFNRSAIAKALGII